jgi:hypothetical protein
MGYKDVEIPDGTDPEDYTYHQRRSELLKFAIEAGHPDMLSRKKFAERYGVNPSTITRDIQALRDEIHEDLSSDAEMISAIIYRKAIREKADRGDWMEAKELLESWNEWLFNTGQQEKAPERMEMDMDAHIESSERKALIGVDLGVFEGVDTSQMVGLDVSDVEGAADGPDGEPTDIPLTDDVSEADGEGGNGAGDGA